MLILTTIIVLGLMGVAFAAILGFAAEYYKVKEDPRIARLLSVIPNANCGACGAAGCHNFAERILEGTIAVSGCIVGGADVAKKIASIMGVEGFEVHKQVSAVHCRALRSERKKRASYSGVQTCSAANLVDGSGLLCKYGCLGFGDCVAVCPFDAIKMKDGTPIVDPEKCTACKKCIAVCPRQIISLRPYNMNVIVGCSSHFKGSDVRKICSVGCISCKICEKESPEIFKVVDSLSVIDYSKTDKQFETAVQKCPTKCIVKQ